MTIIEGKDAIRFEKERQRIDNLDPNSKEAKEKKKQGKECKDIYNRNRMNKLWSKVRTYDDLQYDIEQKDKEIADLCLFIQSEILYSDTPDYILAIIEKQKKGGV